MAFQEGVTKIGLLTQIPLGYVGESNTRTHKIDVSEWLKEFPGAHIIVQVIRPYDGYKYFAATTLQDGILYWTVSPGELIYAGKGYAQVVLTNPETKQEYESRAVGTVVAESLRGFNDMELGETDPATNWVNQVLTAADNAASSVIQAEAQVLLAESAANQAKTHADEAAASAIAAGAQTAPPIIPTANGEVVAVHDSAQRPFAGLRLYGKTTQDGTPTPSAPVPLVNAGAGGKITVKSQGKNLIPYPYVDKSKTENGLTISVNEGGGISANGTPTAQVRFTLTDGLILQPGLYTLSGLDKATTGKIDIGIYDQSWNTIAYINNHVYNRATMMFEIVEPVVLKINIYFNPDVAASWTWIRPQIEFGTVATEYEHYSDGGSLTASTPNGLPGIPVFSGGNYTDASGQMWLCDEIDFGRGVYVQRVKRLVYDANNGSVVGLMNTGTAGKNRVHLATDAANNDNNTAGACMCTMVSAKTASQTYLCMDGIAIDDIHRLTLYIEDVAGMTAADALTWLKSKGVVIIYGLATPIESALSADKLTAYRAMSSQYPNTTVYNDAGAGLGIDYVADTKTYIDQRIAALLNA